MIYLLFQTRKLQNSSVTIAGEGLSLGASLTLDTGDVTEHTAYKYYTDARARASISATGSLSYNSTTGVMSFTMPAQNTSNITEGSNLYFTNARADARIVNAGSANWNTAYGWGNHASAGYVTSSGNTIIGTDTDLSFSGANVLSTIALTDGVITAYTNRVLTLANLGYTGETNATADQTNAEIRAAVEAATDSNVFTNADHSKLDGIATGATNTAAPHYTSAIAVGAGGLTQQNFTTTLKNKLDGIAASANNYVLPFTNNSSNWNTAYGWGNHASAGYLTSFDITTQTDSKYLRSDAGDTSSATYVFSRTSTSPVFDISGHAGASSYNYFLRAGNDGGNKAVHFVNGSTRTADHGANAYVIRNDYGKFVLGKSSQPTELVSSGSLTINSNTAWHAGNDGSGSGLDADLLDGQHGSYYRAYANLTGTPTIPSLSGYATESYVGTQISNLVDSSPAALNTLNELAAAIGDDASFSTTVTNNIATKLPLAGGTMTGLLTINHTNDNQILLTSPSSWTGIGFNDSGGNGTQYIWHNGIHGTFAIGGGGSNVANKKLHVDGGMTIGSSYDTTAVTANSLNVQGTVTATGGNSTNWNTAYTVANAALPKAGGTITGNLNVNGTTTLGNGNADQTHINDTLYLGATDSGDSHFYFGENSSNWYGDHWYWDSGYEVERYSRFAGTDSLIEKHDTRYTHKVQTNRAYERLAHSTGYQIGSYNSVGDNSGKTNPIYVIGDNYRPTDTSVSGMYGIGYAHSNLWGTSNGKPSAWGHYVVEGGQYIHVTTNGGTWSLGEFNRNGNKVWDAGNDGAGSGLDADLLDGQHGSYYYSKTNMDAGRNIVSGTDLDTDLANGGAFSSYGSGGTSWNAPFSYGGVLGWSFTSGIEGQIGFDIRHNQSAYSDFWFRGKNNLGFNPWSKVWHTLNDGSGSGLDADLLDGVHGASFLRSDAADTGSGKITLTATEGLEVGGIRGRAIGNQSGDFIQLYERVNIGYPSGWGASGANAPTQGLSTHGGAQFNVGNVSGAPLTFNGNAIWHAGNDGSGSGLDADTVDGKHKDYLMHYKGTVSGNWDTLFSQTDGHMGVYEVHNLASGHSNHPTGVYTYGGVMSWQLDNSTFKLYSSHTGDLVFQSGWNNDEHSGWRRILNTSYYGDAWTSSNDGAGSGLDADLLDGQQPSASGGANKIAQYASNGYLYPNNWIHPNNGTGLFYSAGVHFYEVGNKMYSSTSYTSAVQGTLWGSSNDGSGSGLDADTVDSLHASSFWRSDTSNNGAIRFDTTEYDFTSSYNPSQQGVPNSIRLWDHYTQTNAPATYGQLLDLYGRSGHWRHQFHMLNTDLKFRYGTYPLSTAGWSSWYTQWHSGNDGSGSGLDADLLDGYNAEETAVNNSIVKRDGTATIKVNGVYLGGTGAANKLEDYEEGTWTPTSTAVTSLGINFAKYTKIGNQVTVLCQFYGIPNVASTVSWFYDPYRIGGLPFQPNADAVGGVGKCGGQYFYAHNAVARSGTNYIEFYTQGSQNSPSEDNDVYLTSDHFDYGNDGTQANNSNDHVDITITYLTDQ